MANINKPSYIFRYHTDESGNLINVKVENSYQVSPINNIVMLDQIPSETERLIIQGANNELLTEVENIDEITSQTFYCDYNEGKVYFDAIHQGKTKVISYYGRGLALISADRVFIPDSLGKGIIETLQDLIDFGQSCLDAIVTLGSAVDIINKLKEDIEKGKILEASLLDLINRGTPLNTSLQSIVPRAETIEPKLKIQNTESNRLLPLITEATAKGDATDIKLKNTITSAVDLDNKISSTGAKKIQITPTLWGSLQSDGNYHYIWQHNLASQSININTYEVTSDGLELATMQIKIKDSNNIEVISEINIDVIVVCSARYYGGQIPSLISFTTDDLLEGVRNKYVKYYTTTIKANQFVLVDGLYEATITHNLNTTKFTAKNGYVNGIDQFIYTEETSATTMKITHDKAEDMTLNLYYAGGAN